MQAQYFGSYLSVQQKLFFTLKKIIYPLLLPSHNCIIIFNVQFSRYILESQRDSMKHWISFLIHCFSQSLNKKWWAKMDSNHRPHDYQSCALASWAIGPYQALLWWRVPGSNRWPPACKAGALPAELTPHIRDSVFCRYISSVPSKLNNVIQTNTLYWP